MNQQIHMWAKCMACTNKDWVARPGSDAVENRRPRDSSHHRARGFEAYVGF